MPNSKEFTVQRRTVKGESQITVVNHTDQPIVLHAGWEVDGQTAAAYVVTIPAQGRKKVFTLEKPKVK